MQAMLFCSLNPNKIKLSQLLLHNLHLAAALLTVLTHHHGGESVFIITVFALLSYGSSAARLVPFF